MADVCISPGSASVHWIVAGVNRITNDGNVRGPAERVSRVGALKAVTLDAAYSLQLEKQIGSIVPGKLANFTILGDNPVTVAPETIKDVQIWGTVLEGRLQPIEPGNARQTGSDSSIRTAGVKASASVDSGLDQALVDQLKTWNAHSDAH